MFINYNTDKVPNERLPYIMQSVKVTYISLTPYISLAIIITMIYKALYQKLCNKLHIEFNFTKIRLTFVGNK